MTMDKHTMSNAIQAQSATQLAVAGKGEELVISQVLALINKAATSAKIRGVTLENRKLGFNGLRDKTLALYRSQFPAIYGINERLPAKVYDAICEQTEVYITESLKAVNFGNVLSVVTKAHDKKDGQYVQRVIVTGENVVELEVQKTYALAFKTDCERRLSSLLSKGQTANTDMEKFTKRKTSLENDIARHKLAITAIETTLAEIAKVAPKAP